jgi:hypothetical protein
MPPPISLTDSEMSAIMSAAKPLSPRDRDKFLRHIAQVIADMPEAERGDGAVYRAIHATLKMYFDAPGLRIDELRSRAY